MGWRVVRTGKKEWSIHEDGDPWNEYVDAFDKEIDAAQEVESLYEEEAASASRTTRKR